MNEKKKPVHCSVQNFIATAAAALEIPHDIKVVQHLLRMYSATVRVQKRTMPSTTKEAGQHS